MTRGIMTAIAVVGVVAFASHAMAQSATTVKGSKSNSDNLQGQTVQSGGPPPAAKAVKGSKSNSSDRMGGGGGVRSGGSNPNDAINLNSSRSNNY